MEQLPSGKRFSCQLCQKTYKWKKLLDTHIRAHVGEKSYQCAVCNKAFSDGSYLYQHEKTHSSEKRFECDVCNKRFRFKGNCKKHRLLHDGRIFKCNICSAKFTAKPNLTTHMKWAHIPNTSTDSTRRLFDCLFCKHKSITRGQALAHLIGHTRECHYFCKSCPLEFTTRGGLKGHYLRIHKKATPTKKFPCELCGKGFLTRGEQCKHLRTHLGEKPVKCPVCGMGFPISGNLSRHMEKVHYIERKRS